MRVPSSPKWTAAAMLDYRMGDLDGWTPQLSGSCRHFSSQYGTLTSAPVLIPPYPWVDRGLRMTGARYDLSLYAKNLLDKRAFSFIGGPFTSTTPGETYVAGPP